MKQSLHRNKVTFLLVVFALLYTSASATTIIVTLTNFKFTPDSFVINVGDTVKWIEGSGAGHTTTSSVIPAGAVPWNSNIDASTSLSYPVLVAGDYHYVCTPHQSLGMIGKFTAVFPLGISSPPTVGLPITVLNNPVKNQIVLQFNLQKPAQVEISLYDLLGKKLEVLSNDVMKNGSYIRSYPLSENYRQGIYFLSITLGDLKETERIVIE